MTIADVKREAVKHGAIVELNESPFGSTGWIETPRGMMWTCEDDHTIYIQLGITPAERQAGLRDAMERMKAGTEPCTRENCETCEDDDA